MVKELIYEAKYQISAKPGGPLTSYYPLDLYPKTKVRLGAVSYTHLTLPTTPYV